MERHPIVELDINPMDADPSCDPTAFGPLAQLESSDEAVVGLADLASDPALLALCRLDVIEPWTRPVDAFLRADLPHNDCVVEQAFVLRRSTLCARLRVENGDDSLMVARGPGWESLFDTRYAGRSAHVVFAERVLDLRLRLVRGLWAELGRQPLVSASTRSGVIFVSARGGFRPLDQQSRPTVAGPRNLLFPAFDAATPLRYARAP